MNPVQDILSAINTAGIATTDTDLFPGIVRDDGTPDWCIFVMLSGGLKPEQFFNNDGERRQVFVQIRLRTGINPADGGHDTMQSLFTTIHRQEIAGYESWLCDEPIPLGLDSKSRLQWSMNVTATFCTT